MVDAEKKPWDPTLLDQFSEQGDSEFYTVTMTEDTATIRMMASRLVEGIGFEFVKIPGEDRVIGRTTFRNFKDLAKFNEIIGPLEK